MNNQFKIFLKHFADENKQRNTIPRLKTLRRMGDNSNPIRSGGTGTGIASPTVCPNEVAFSMKSLARMMGVSI